MFVTQIEAAIASASPSAFPALNAAIWSAHANGVLSDDDAQRLAEMVHARQTVTKASSGPVGGARRAGSLFPTRKPQRPPVRSVAVERRRRLAASGPMPPALAARFTTGELAVLRIVADQCRDHGRCTLPVDAIAARAGVGRTTCQRAIREAGRLGMIHVEERRRHGAPNLPNRITVTDREWRTWIERGAVREGEGSESGTARILVLYREGVRRLRRAQPPSLALDSRARQRHLRNAEALRWAQGRVR